MAKPFDLRKQLKLHDNTLLRDFFAGQPGMDGVSWDSLGPHEVEPIVAIWENMPDDRRRQSQVVLQDVHELSDDRGQRVLAEEVEWREPDKLPAFFSQSSRSDKALWAYLHVRAAFDEAAIFARADALSRGQFANRWNSLPKEPITVTPEKLAALQDEVRGYYWKKELRGEVCRVHHYPRANGAEYFFAYLPDWPDKLLVFDDEGNLTPREQNYAFSNVFVYLPADGAVELIARGGKKVQMPLRQAFCNAVLGIDVDDAEPIRPAYQLDHLLSPEFALLTEPEDRIATVRLRRVRLVPKVPVPAIEHMDLKFNEYATLEDVRGAIGRLLGAYSLAHEGGDKNHTNGVHYQKEQWTKAIKERKKAVKADLIRFIDGGTLNYLADLASVQTVHDDAERALQAIHTLGIHQVAERAELYRTMRQGEPFLRMKDSFDLWCALWFWPADKLDQSPLPTEMAENAVSASAWDTVRTLAAQRRFFHWEIEFPDVFNARTHGFDAVLGNPPWDVSKPNSREFFSAVDPLYRGYGKQEAIQKQNGFFRQDADMEHRWLEYCAFFKGMTNWVKYAGFPFGSRVTHNAQDKPEHDFPIGDRGRGSFASSQRRHDRWKQKREESSGYADAEHAFRHQGSADVNLYKLFLEQARTILAPAGRLGMIVPAGLYADHGTSDLRKLFLTQSTWEWVFGFINWRKIFQSVYYRFKFCICIIQRGGQSRTVNAAFDRYKIEEWEQPHDVLVYVEASQLSMFSPKSFAFLETRTQRDVLAATKVFAHCSLLGSHTGENWRVQYTREFDMTNDSHLFPPRPKWEEWGYRPDEYSRWIKGPWQPIEHLWSELGKQPIAKQEGARSQLPYNKLPVSRADIPEGVILSREATYFIRESDIPVVAFTDASGKTLALSVKAGERTEDVIVEGPAIAVPLYEGRMIGHLEFTAKGWVSGKARSAVWREIQPDERWLEPQYLMANSAYCLSLLNEHLNTLGTTHSARAVAREFERLKDSASRSAWWLGKPTGVSIMDVTSATNARTTVCALTTLGPNGHSAPMLRSAVSNPGLAGVLSTFTWDRMVRLRTNGVHLIWAILEESPLPSPGAWLDIVAQLTIRLNATGAINAELSLRCRKGLGSSWRSSWALTDHERLRLRCMLDAIVAAQFGLDEGDYRQIMLDCDHPKKGLTQLAYSGFDPKGFWRVDKDKHPEHRQTVLSLVAFHDLQGKITACGADVKKGIEAFCTQNDGEGWMLPEMLRLADYGLGHDDRARQHQPVRECFGPRFYDWQLAQSPEESWRECHLHARNLLGPEGYQALLDELDGKTPPISTPPSVVTRSGSKDIGGRGQGKLFETEQLPLFDGKK